MKNRTLVTLGATAATAVLVTASATTAASPDPVPTRGKASAIHAKSNAAALCSGGGLVWMKAKTSNGTPFEPQSTGVANERQLVPGTRVTFKGPKKGKDTLLLTFTAEANYFGTYWLGFDAQVDGSSVDPVSILALTQGGGYETHSAQLCTKVGPGTHTVEAHVYIPEANGTTKGWLDDYTFTVERFK